RPEAPRTAELDVEPGDVIEDRLPLDQRREPGELHAKVGMRAKPRPELEGVRDGHRRNRAVVDAERGPRELRRRGRERARLRGTKPAAIRGKEPKRRRDLELGRGTG